jgi:hypothetical protein
MADTNSVTAREPLTGDPANFLNEVKVEHALAARGRLIFALDATASRRRTWDTAASLTAGMFRETSAIGSLDLQLAYFRGEKECRASGWVSNADHLVKMMAKVDCEAGMTQLERILVHAQKETAKLQVNALVFIGDAMEENPDVLTTRARELGKLGVRAFMFQEGADPDVQRVFQDIAASTGGAYAKFDAGAAKQLGELLQAVARYVTGGMAALESRKDVGSTLLLEQLRGGA